MPKHTIFLFCHWDTHIEDKWREQVAWQFSTQIPQIPQIQKQSAYSAKSACLNTTTLLTFVDKRGSASECDIRLPLHGAVPCAGPKDKLDCVIYRNTMGFGSLPCVSFEEADSL